MELKSFLLALLSVFCISGIAFAQAGPPPEPEHEEVTLTTYYPAPYGDYDAMTSNTVRLNPRNTRPSPAAEGLLYYDNGTGVNPEGVTYYDGAGWVLVGAGAGDITSVIAGTGLTGGGTSGDVTLNANTNYLQRRVTGACAANQAIRVISANGTVTCVNLPPSAICTWNGHTYSTGYQCYSGICAPGQYTGWRCNPDGSWTSGWWGCSTLPQCGT